MAAIEVKVAATMAAIEVKVAATMAATIAAIEVSSGSIGSHYGSHRGLTWQPQWQPKCSFQFMYTNCGYKLVFHLHSKRFSWVIIQLYLKNIFHIFYYKNLIFFIFFNDFLV